MIFWHGSENDIAAAKKYFWKIVSELVNADYNLGVTASVDKMLDVMNIVKQKTHLSQFQDRLEKKFCISLMLM